MSMCWCSRIVGVARLLFESGDYFVQHFRRCGDYSRAATNRERRLIERIRYVPFEVIPYVCIGSHAVAMFSAHALREGPGWGPRAHERDDHYPL